MKIERMLLTPVPTFASKSAARTEAEARGTYSADAVVFDNNRRKEQEKPTFTDPESDEQEADSPEEPAAKSAAEPAKGSPLPEIGKALDVTV